MNEKNTKKLKVDFPRLFRKSEADPGPLQYWGFECADGWYDLIYKLSQDVEQTALAAGLGPSSRSWPRVLQVKEKFGGLRFYIRTPSNPERLKLRAERETFLEFTPQAGIEAIRNLVREAEQKSYSVCEKCGVPGKVYQDGWVRTLCENCERRSQEEREEHERT